MKTAMLAKYDKMIKTLANEYFSSKEDIEDAMQEGYIKVVELADKVPNYNPDGWMYTVINNLMKDLYRKQRTRSKAAFYDDSDADHNDPYHYLVEYEQAQTMYHNYDKLPDILREVCELRYQKEMSYDAISKELGIPPATVGTRLNRAREVLNREA